MYNKKGCEAIRILKNHMSDNVTPVKGVDLYPWLGGMIGAKIFSVMDQCNQEVESCGRLHPPPPQERSQDFILDRSRLLILV